VCHALLRSDGCNDPPASRLPPSPLTRPAVFPRRRAVRPQFFRIGKLSPLNPSEAYQPDTRLRLGVGVKAAGVGGQKLNAGTALRWGLLPASCAARRRPLVPLLSPACSSCNTP
jgi:hypothetical protein